MAVVKLTDGENELKVIHRHPISFLSGYISIALFVAMPILFAIFFLIIPSDITESLFAGDATVGILFITVTWLLFAWMYGWWRWTDHYLDIIVITDKRIFEIKQNGFFHRETTSFSFDKIQNIKVTQLGVLSTVLNYGDILIETASETENLHLEKIPDPNSVKTYINELQDNDKAKYS